MAFGELPQSRRSSSGTWPLARPGDLSDELRQCGDDIVEAFRAKQPFQCALEATRLMLWTMAFNPRDGSYWDTSLPIPKPSMPEPPKRRDLTAIAGNFTQDLPPSKCARRHGPKRKQPLVAVPCRRKGATAFIQARYSESKRDLDWLWCDAHGKGADPKFIHIGPKSGSYSQDQAKAAAIAHADTVMDSHVLLCNVEQAAYWMRCRLARVTADQQPAGTMVQRAPNPTSADFRALIEPQSLTDLALRAPSTDKRRLLQEALLERNG